MKKLKEKARDKSIQIRLTEEELNALQSAKRDKGTLARYAREKLLSDTTHTERQQTISQYTDLVFQLKKIGTNINQIAYQLNKDDMSKVEAIVALRKELANIRAVADAKVEEVLK
ncbi:MobC family plasmid mobilization relaxosome protein [Comamonas thiooxydans]|uniref:plasmid mobilization relaxosome protein MobC n=1 Tax=Comamonas thiooxydans TaxID=363952 RepID=UPI00244759A5|nr:plasmid mobilization relaxosome protein MobC [Comamonas thiooxydans]MDH1255609.1 MobC family plasmid mobilization relaxosome protein [Comamonas thiooxydans]